MIEILNQIGAALERQAKDGLVADAASFHRGELAYVAALLALSSTGEQPAETVRALWPFPEQIFRPHYGREDLVQAAALIIGEILRVDEIAEKARWKPTHRANDAAYLVRLLGTARNKATAELQVVYEDIDKEMFFSDAVAFAQNFAPIE